MGEYSERGVLSDACANVSQDGAPSVFECNLRGRDGGSETYVCVAWRAEGDEIHTTLRLKAGAATGVGRNADVERRARLLDVLSDHLPIVVWACDTDGVFLIQEGKALGTAGLQKGQFVGKNIFDIYAGEKTLPDIRAALEGRPVHNSSTTHEVSWESWLLPATEPDGSISGVVGVSMDVSNFRRVEQELLARIELIQKQQQVIKDLGVPIIQVWDRVLTLPLMGVVDSSRAAEVMTNLLEAIIRTGARFAILDLTGVDVVDTATASHLLQLASGIRLMGAEGILTGIRPTMAQTMISLGLDMSSIVTLSSLRDAVQLCIRRMATNA